MIVAPPRAMASRGIPNTTQLASSICTAKVKRRH